MLNRGPVFGFTEGMCRGPSPAAPHHSHTTPEVHRFCRQGTYLLLLLYTRVTHSLMLWKDPLSPVRTEQRRSSPLHCGSAESSSGIHSWEVDRWVFANCLRILQCMWLPGIVLAWKRCQRLLNPAAVLRSARSKYESLISFCYKCLPVNASFLFWTLVNCIESI